MEFTDKLTTHNQSVVDLLMDEYDELSDEQREAFDDACTVTRDMFDHETMSDEFNHCIVQHMIDSGYQSIELPGVVKNLSLVGKETSLWLS